MGSLAKEGDYAAQVIRDPAKVKCRAARVMNDPQPLIGALRKLTEKNLSNLMPHPAYSAFYYSHPTLLERERALAGS